MRLFHAFVCAVVSVCACAMTLAAPPTNHHVVIISVDGLRPDVMLRAKTPVIHDLMERGSFTCWAQTTAVSVTLPSHVSMLTGVSPQRHEIEWNDDMPFSKPVYPSVPTIFELAHNAGYKTAMAAGKSKFTTLNKPGTIDSVFVSTDKGTTDDQVAEKAVEIINRDAPDMLFVHFPMVDHTGHAKGWGSKEQVAAAGKADDAIGRVVEAIRKKGLEDSTLFIISADHGGAGRGHGPDDPRSRHIPWIAVGPGIRQNFDLTLAPDRRIRTEDTFATACYWLSIPLPEHSEGAPVMEIFDKGNASSSAAEHSDNEAHAKADATK